MQEQHHEQLQFLWPERLQQIHKVVHLLIHLLDYQHQLLREMVIQNDNNDSGHITVSSDKPAWIFIDDRLVSTSPLFKHNLEPGEHTIKIASCPTYDFMKPEDNISWNDYWSMASDGSCREPSEEELNELIAQGLAKEITIETVDGYAMMQIDYQPGVNLCCHDSPTKTIEVNMTEAPLVYAWSFVNDDWIQASDIQN